MGFIKYVGKQGTGNRIALGTVRLNRHKKGHTSLTFNKFDATSLFGTNSYVELFYDPSTKTIALRPRPDRVEGAIKIMRLPAVSIGICGFCSQFGITPPCGTASGPFGITDGMVTVSIEKLVYDTRGLPKQPSFVIERK